MRNSIPPEVWAIEKLYDGFVRGSRWDVDRLVFAADLRGREKMVREEWELHHAALIDEVGEEIAEDITAHTAWVVCALMSKRPRGEDFVERLRGLLEGTSEEDG